jgi:hypothetical protein
MTRYLTRTLVAAVLLCAATPVPGSAAVKKTPPGGAVKSPLPPTVKPNLPLVATAAAREVTSTSATLTGTVNPQGSPTIYAFQYGTSTLYAQQSAAQYAGNGNGAQPVSETVSELRPGTTYHVRVIAANGNGNGVGGDLTFKTTGTAPPAGTPPVVTTGTATLIGAHEALLNGTVNPSGSSVRYYFEFGLTQPYVFHSASQTLPAAAAVTQVSAPATGLQGAHTYHYRLVAVNAAGEVSAGPDQTLVTPLPHRIVPTALQVKASPAVRRTLPDVVTVTGTLEPAEVEVALACKGFVDIVFRTHGIAVATQRAGLEPDCTFRLPIRFAVRRRLHGGHLQLHVLFPGNAFLTRIEAPVKTIQVG